MIESQRADFLQMLGDAYAQYGMPRICGWVEGLLLLEPREWSQKAVSSTLREILPSSKYPASVPSVNRALRILEEYGIVEKRGSRKTGYIYTISSTTSLMTSMLARLDAMSRDIMRRMLEFGRSVKDDPGLRKAVSYEVKMAKSWIRLMECMTESVSPKRKE